MLSAWLPRMCAIVRMGCGEWYACPRVVVDSVVGYPGWWFPGVRDRWQVLEVRVHAVL